MSFYAGPLSSKIFPFSLFAFFAMGSGCNEMDLTSRIIVCGLNRNSVFQEYDLTNKKTKTGFNSSNFSILLFEKIKNNVESLGIVLKFKE